MREDGRCVQEERVYLLGLEFLRAVTTKSELVILLTKQHCESYWVCCAIVDHGRLRLVWGIDGWPFILHSVKRKNLIILFVVETFTTFMI